MKARKKRKKKKKLDLNFFHKFVQKETKHNCILLAEISPLEILLMQYLKNVTANI